MRQHDGVACRSVDLVRDRHHRDALHFLDGVLFLTPVRRTDVEPTEAEEHVNDGPDDADDCESEDWCESISENILSDLDVEEQVSGRNDDAPATDSDHAAADTESTDYNAKRHALHDVHASRRVHRIVFRKYICHQFAMLGRQAIRSMCQIH